MIGAAKPPASSALRLQLAKESLFGQNHWDTLSPTSDGYPDIDTYRIYQFYIETHNSPQMQGRRWGRTNASFTLSSGYGPGTIDYCP